MSLPKPPDQAKLVVSLFMNDRKILDESLLALKGPFGEIDILSPWFDFDYTDYYRHEMGTPLYRRVAVFKTLISPGELAEVKTITNRLEKLWETNGKRGLNIDPGYLLLSRFILATGKDFAHRIYLEHGIYADLTLIYKQGEFQGFDWTYPDYQSQEMKLFLTLVREKYRLDLKATKRRNQ